MKRYLYATLALLLIASPLSFAGDGPHDGKRGHHGDKHWDDKHRDDKHRDDKHRNEKHRNEKHRNEKHRGDGEQSGGEKAHSVPEIDAAGAGVAFALLAGLVAIRRERRAAK
ncbi:hypothetical protein ACNKU7_05530 [Microbulbifer sp. SA54]|uniref:hypothetical protein n=1 Tax=Microbulbifer sp. SA54 TaxID=3401577 RepID=UPI003AAD317B